MERYARGSHTFLNAQNIHFRTAPDPQLAVSKGLVTDHLRKLRSGKSVLDWRCCRASYGTLCKVAYEKNNPGMGLCRNSSQKAVMFNFSVDHRGKKVHKDPINGKLYISNAIAWFIRKVSMNAPEIGLSTHVYKGEPIRVNDAIMHNFSRKLTPGDPQRAFPTWIIKSDNDVDILPFQMGPGAEILCEIQSDLSNADQREFKQKNRRFWQTSQRHYLVEYQIQVIIGPADLRFELCEDHVPPYPFEMWPMAVPDVRKNVRLTTCGSDRVQRPEAEQRSAHPRRVVARDAADDDDRSRGCRNAGYAADATCLGRERIRAAE